MSYNVNLQCTDCGLRYAVLSDELRVCPRCVPPALTTSRAFIETLSPEARKRALRALRKAL